MDVAVTSRHEGAEQRAHCHGRYRENFVSVARAHLKRAHCVRQAAGERAGAG
jgi:hypothetical protein